jgi:hypothetical protein
LGKTKVEKFENQERVAGRMAVEKGQHAKLQLLGQNGRILLF